MMRSNIRVVSNIYPVKLVTTFLHRMTPVETIIEEENRAYFQQISDLEALKTACDSCSCTCSSCMRINDPTEKPWGRVRIDDALIDICKCQRTSCKRFYSECRTDLERPHVNQSRD